MRLTGRSVHPGVFLGPTRLVTSHDLVVLHHSEHHEESDRQLKAMLRNPDFQIHTLSDLSYLRDERAEHRTLLEVTFWSAVNEVLEVRGSGILYAVASVISRYVRSSIFSADPDSSEDFQGLVDLGTSVLGGLLQIRRPLPATSPAYVVLAPSLSLPDAVSLDPPIAGFALGTCVDAKLKIAASLLGVPMISGLEGLEEQAAELKWVRLDGTRGLLESAPRPHPGSGA